MTVPTDCAMPPYPGSTASPAEILRLAGACRQSAHALLAASPNGSLAAAPAHLCALQAVELALNARRRHCGERSEAIRKRLHDQFCPDVAIALGVRRKTVAHLAAMSADREYLLARYAPASSQGGTPRNRLTAILDEILSKVGRRIAAARPTAQGPCRGAPTRDLTPPPHFVPLPGPVPEPRSPR